MYDNHPADAGSEMFEREKDLGLRQSAQRMLEQIDHAFHRMGRGQYGVCEGCGREIEVDRLEVMPMAATCIDCARAREQLPEQFHRPVEEKLLNPPFGRTWRDDSTFVGYDGEDAWQDVGVYGTSETPQDVPGAISFEDMYRSDEQPNSMVEPIDVMVDETGEPLENRDMGRAPWAAGGAVGERADRPLLDPGDPLDTAGSGPQP